MRNAFWQAGIDAGLVENNIASCNVIHGGHRAFRRLQAPERGIDELPGHERRLCRQRSRQLLTQHIALDDIEPFAGIFARLKLFKRAPVFISVERFFELMSRVVQSCLRSVGVATVVVAGVWWKLFPSLARMDRLDELRPVSAAPG